MLFSDRGIVLKTVAVGERDKILTLYTEEHGLISAYSSGSRAVKSKLLAASDMFCFADYVLYSKDGKQFTVREAELIECFFGIRKDLVRTALGNYVSEVSRISGLENTPDIPYMRLVLNTLYAISSGKYPLAKIKAAFEARAVAILGFCPDLNACSECGSVDDQMVLEVMNGNLICTKCRRELEQSLYFEPKGEEGHRTVLAMLSPAALSAFRYCIGCKLEHLLSFEISGETDQRLFTKAAETYLLNQLDCAHSALDFYREVVDKNDLDHWKG